MNLYIIQCESTIQQKINDRKSAEELFDTNNNLYNEILQSKNILKKTFDLGQISKLEYLKKINSFNSDFANYDTAKINLLCCIDEMEMIEYGVID